MRRLLTSPAGAAVLIIALVVIFYARTLSFGLFWDDYAELRPRSWDAVMGAWTGEWDPGGVWPVFYRPLTMMLYATLYSTFGHDATSLHLINLVLLGVAAWMLRAFVAREVSSPMLGTVASVLLIVHPETPSTLAAWISQHFHLAALLSVLAALLVWQRVRGSSAGRWAWVLLPLTIGVLVKEDVLVVALALLGWQWLRARIAHDVPAPTRATGTLMALWIAAYLAWRWAMLNQLGGYVLPDAARAALNLASVPLFTFALQWIPDAHGVSLFSGAGVALLLWLAWQRQRDAPRALVALAAGGVCLGVITAMPLVLTAGHTRVHLPTLAACLTFTGLIGIVIDAWPRRPLSRWATVWLVAAALAMAAANWRHTNWYAPCSEMAIYAREDVLTWPFLSADVRADVLAQAARCDALSLP